MLLAGAILAISIVSTLVIHKREIERISTKRVENIDEKNMLIQLFLV